MAYFPRVFWLILCIQLALLTCCIGRHSHWAVIFNTCDNWYPVVYKVSYLKLKHNYIKGFVGKNSHFTIKLEFEKRRIFLVNQVVLDCVLYLEVTFNIMLSCDLTNVRSEIWILRNKIWAVESYRNSRAYEVRVCINSMMISRVQKNSTKKSVPLLFSQRLN
jgi:hypothetical protein